MLTVRRARALLSILIAACPALAHAQVPAPEARDYFGSAVAAGDFNADGFADLAVGVPSQDVNGRADAGAVDVFYGAATGFSAPQVWTQDAPGVPDAAEAGEGMGGALTTGDFNGDGVGDLAIGVPGESFAAGVTGDGAVVVLYGKAQQGLLSLGSQIWGQAAGVPFAAEAHDHFGEALGAGDFNGDRCDDLVIGIPDEDVGNRVDAGSVAVIYGSRATSTAVRGLQVTSPAAQGWYQDIADVAGVSETGDQFGLALAAADFNKDGKADLAIGVPAEAAGSDGGDGYAGAVNLIYGSPNGLSATFKADEIIELFTLGREGIERRFGSGLATADFDGNGAIELAVSGLEWDGDWQDFVGGGLWIIKVGNGPAALLKDADLGYGDALVAGDFNGDRVKDLAVEANARYLGGSIDVFHGAGAGGAGAGPNLHSPTFRTSAIRANFLATGDFNGDGNADVAAGDPYADVGVRNTSSYLQWVGAVNVLYGSQSGISLAGKRRLLDTPCEFMEQAGDCDDVDQDGVPAGLERLAGIDSVVNDRDSDDDGIPDGIEIVGLKRTSSGGYEPDVRSKPTKSTLAVVLLYPPGVSGFAPGTLKSKLESYFVPIASNVELLVLPKAVTDGTALNNSCLQTVASEGSAPGQQAGWIASDAALATYIGGPVAGDGDVTVLAPYAHVARVCLGNDASTPVKGAIQYKGGWQFMVKLRSPVASWDAARLEQWHRALASLTAHELGHSLGLGHGGDTDEDCSPLYPSVMNHMYDFQLGADTGPTSFCNTLGFSTGVLESASPLEIKSGQSEYDVLNGVTTKTGAWVTPEHLAFLACLGRGDVPSTIVTPFNPILTICGTRSDNTPIYCANWDQDDYFGAQEDTQVVGLYYAIDQVYSPYSVLYARTGGVRPSQAPISGCAESELYTTEADLQVLLRDHDDFRYILAPRTLDEPSMLERTARHAGCGIGPCTKALVEPVSAGQLEAMRGWW